MDQLGKRLKRTIVHAEGRTSFLGGLGTCSPREILKMYAPDEAIWGYSRPFRKFFSPLKIQKLLEIDKDYKCGKLLILLLYLFVGSSS